MKYHNLISENLKNITLTEQQIDELVTYAIELETWNKTYNLTAVKGVDNMIKRHVFDSLPVVEHIQKNNIKKLADVGCGAGIPGIILAISNPDLQVYLIESINKKCRFLIHIIQKLGLNKRVFVISQRVEKYQPDFYFDGIICRAFTNLENFINLTHHLGNKDSLWIAMKSEYTKEEELLVQKTNFSIMKNIQLEVEFTEASRHLILLKKQ